MLDDTKMLTRSGSRMQPQTRNRLIELLTDPDNDGLSQKEIAELAGVCQTTVRNYLTPEVWDIIRKLRLEVMSRMLAKVDRAIFAKAIKGDITAAKLIYSRWDAEKEQVSAQDISYEDIEDIDGEIERIRAEIHVLEQDKGAGEEPGGCSSGAQDTPAGSAEP